MVELLLDIWLFAMRTKFDQAFLGGIWWIGKNVS